MSAQSRRLLPSEAAPTQVRVGIALGSNEGDRLTNLQRAREQILALPAARASDDVGSCVGACLCAPVFETAPVHCPAGAGLFLNTVIELPFASNVILSRLLADLRAIENTLGRPSRYPRNAPRPIDLDLLYAGQMVSDTPELTLPHPRIAERRFVLEPLAAIRTSLVLPGMTKPISQLLAELNDQGEVRLYASKW